MKKNPYGTPPENVNCDGTRPANFTDRPSYQQLKFLHQRQPRLPKTTTHASQFNQADIPDVMSPKFPNRTHKTWPQAASRITTKTTNDPQTLSSMLETVKYFLETFLIQKLSHTLRSLILQL